ncbi:MULTISPECIES: hypothetical protein [Enterobacteriaceae]|uniref:hypothetical protein n=1 Tax=Enterobacteriaceae TaxID=543 RepID=UPI00195CB546|nr:MULTISPECIES: hypothetical protein [Enterobacteriaceae]MDF3564963.1 hypothetical protein [Enterobacter hormaechei]MDK3052665.1 hypothetical protein [Klebsiella michiganensis]QRS62507.1 hypothetical protein I6K62_11385 [Klebsiella oxytoca]
MQTDRIEPKAYFDSLLIMDEVPQSMKPISFIEYHLFSYLSCVLSLFRGDSISNWGYNYTVTQYGFPFSNDLQNAINLITKKGFIFSDDNGLFQPSNEIIKTELDNFSYDTSLLNRRDLISTALKCGLNIPSGAIRNAIKNSPGVSLHSSLSQSAPLLDDTDNIELIYDEYKVISDMIGKDNKDLLSPAVIWLSARVMRIEG